MRAASRPLPSRCTHMPQPHEGTLQGDSLQDNEREHAASERSLLRACRGRAANETGELAGVLTRRASMYAPDSTLHARPSILRNAGKMQNVWATFRPSRKSCKNVRTAAGAQVARQQLRPARRGPPMQPDKNGCTANNQLRGPAMQTIDRICATTSTEFGAQASDRKDRTSM